MTDPCIFKIRDRVTGLYSTGGSNPKFNKRGKAWGTLAHVRAHLALFTARSYRPLPWSYNDCEVVTFEFVEVEARPISIAFDEVVDRQRDMTAQREAKRQAWKEAREREQLALLQKKYPS